MTEPKKEETSEVVARVAKALGFNKPKICSGENCGMLLIFMLTYKGEWLPITVRTGEPHFADCPDVKKFRKKRERDR